MISTPTVNVRSNGAGMSQPRGTGEKVSPDDGHSGEHAGIVAIVPAYNESRFIGSVVLKARQCAATVLVVDDGSTDATAEIASLAGAVVIRHDRNLGKGAALNTGLSRARALEPAAVVLLDGDGQHLPQEMTRVIEPILSGQADIVVGSRYLDGLSKVPGPRVFGHYLFNILTNGASGVALTDSQCGYRAFSRKAVDDIAFRSLGFSVESEMQLIASEHHLRVVEVPVTVQYPDSPKRPLVAHGLIVLNGVLRFIGQYRPLLFFGVPGLLLFLVAVGWATWVVTIYDRSQTLALGYFVASALLGSAGLLCLFCGVILHSIRGMLLDLVGPKRETDEHRD